VSRQVFLYDPPDRFVAGTVGLPGRRTFFLQATAGTRVTSVALVGSLWTWGMIVYAHLRFRQSVAAGRVKASSFRMPGAPYANWFVLGFLVLIALFLAIDPSTRVALYVAPVWFLLLAVGYRAVQSNKVA